VVVVRQQADRHDLDWIEPLGPAEDPGGDVVELRAGRSSRRPCKVRQVTSTRAPSSGR
jgi:hypothetical protein